MSKSKRKKRLAKCRKESRTITDIGDGKIEITTVEGGILCIKRRSRNPEEISNLTKLKQWERCIDYFRGRCVYCLQKPIGSEQPLTRDHFMPRSIGGNNSGTNIVPACGWCNRKKGSKNPRTWCSDDQLERIYNYFWDFRIHINLSKKSKHAVEWISVGLGE